MRSLFPFEFPFHSLNVCKVGLLPGNHLGSDCVKPCCKIVGGFGFMLQTPLAELSHPAHRSDLVLPCRDCCGFEIGF
jgi:hypothetical protein